MHSRSLPLNRSSLMTSGAILAGAILLLLSAFTRWWHLIQMPEPSYVALFRLSMCLLSLGAIFALIRPKRQSLILSGVGFLALTLPFVMLLTIVTRDEASISMAVSQAIQADRLVNYISRTATNTQVPWTEQREMRGRDVIRNDYTLVDGIETASYFCGAGWYLALCTGILLLLTAWYADAPAFKSSVLKMRPYVAVVSVFLTFLFFGRLVVGHYYWNQARAWQAEGSYDRAVEMYLQAEKWDRRLDYDLTFHFELGRCYAHLNRTEEPDYWAFMGETYCNSGQYKLAYEAFHNRIISPRANPALATRYANIMLRMGVEDYLVKRPGSALLKWEQGILFDPTNVELMYALSMGYAKVGDYRQSNVWSAKLIEANEGVGLFRSMYVASLTYRKVITAAAWANMAWSYHQIGDEERAVVCKAYSTDIKSHRPLELDESLQTAKRQE